MHDAMWDGASWWWMAAAMLAVWLVIVGLVVYVVRELTGTGARDARAVLDGRYARGEIDDEDYQRRRAALRGPRR